MIKLRRFNSFFPILLGKEAVMGKSLNGKELGWRKLTSLNLIVMQEAFNKLKTDNARKNSKKILVDMLNKAVDTDLLVKNVEKQINTVIAKEEKKVLHVKHTLCYFSRNGKYVFEMHDTKTNNGKEPFP